MLPTPEAPAVAPSPTRLGRQDPRGRTRGPGPPPTSRLTRPVFRSLRGAQAQDASGEHAVGAAPDLLGRGVGGGWGSGGAGVGGGEEGAEAALGGRAGRAARPGRTPRPASAPPTPASRALHPKPAPGRPTPRPAPHRSAASRGPTWGGRGGALVAVVKLEEEIEVELLVLLQPRHVGTDPAGSESGVGGHCPAGEGSRVRVRAGVRAWGCSGVQRSSMGPRRAGVGSRVWGPESGPGRVPATGTCGRGPGSAAPCTRPRVPVT